MDFFDTVNKRCSIREYSVKAIAKAELEKIIDAARLAPTARCEQPWDFIVLEARSDLSYIAEIAEHGRFLKDAAACIIVVTRDTKYYLEDGCAATENILLAATALGIGSCWIAGDKKSYTTQIMEYLGVVPGYKLVSIISLGYPAAEVMPKEKRTLEDVLHWQRFKEV